ncbi:MAG: ribose-5-phosphate isomerase RpiA [Planctomycetaceae bacterium]
MPAPDPRLAAIADRALQFVPEGSVVGLGTGRAAAEFIRELGARVQRGFRVRGVPTSDASAALARELGIPLVTLDEIDAIDVDIDGADEVDPDCNLIKGLGGALLREKIVAAASRKVVILVGEEKLVPKLGAHGTLPVEVVPFGLPTCRRALAALGCPPNPRMRDGRLFVSDNGNYILDCQLAPLDRPAELEREIRAIPGVVETGLFLNMAHTVLVQRGDRVEVRERSGA